MYRSRARAAHVLQTSAPLGSGGEVPPSSVAAPPAAANLHQQQNVAFFNPLAYQNGHTEPPYQQESSNKGRNMIISKHIGMKAYLYLIRSSVPT